MTEEEYEEYLKDPNNWITLANGKRITKDWIPMVFNVPGTDDGQILLRPFLEERKKDND